MTYTYRNLIVTNAQVDEARTQFAEVMGPPGEGMFVVPLYDITTGLLTHWISTGSIEEEYANILPLDDLVPTPYDPDPHPRPMNRKAWRDLAKANGYTITPLAALRLNQGLNVTTQDPYVQMEALGLTNQSPDPVLLPVVP